MMMRVFQGKQGPNFSKFFYKPPKEYKASTLDWLGGQANITTVAKYG